MLHDRIMSYVYLLTAFVGVIVEAVAIAVTAYLPAVLAGIFILVAAPSFVAARLRVLRGRGRREFGR